MKFSQKLKMFIEVSWIETIYFNFKYLPFFTALKLPILLSQCELFKCGGKVKIQCAKVKFGMIKIGFRRVSIFGKQNTSWDNNGGTVIFEGRADIGSGSGISIGSKGLLSFGEQFLATVGLKIVACKSVEFGKKVTIGWQVVIVDNSFHVIRNKFTLEESVPIKKVKIGDLTWIASYCTLLPGSIVPSECILAANTVLHKDLYDCGSNCLFGGDPVKILKKDVFMCPDEPSVLS